MIISTKNYHIEINLYDVLCTFSWKVYASTLRLLDIIRLFPSRFIRLFLHPFVGVKELAISLMNRSERKILPLNMAFWWIELTLMILECLGVAEFFEIIHEFVKFNSRPLHDWEKEMAKTVFGNTLNYNRIRIDEYSFAGPKQKRFCYVSFFVVNSWGPMTNTVLLHEMMHIWQFQKMGIVYIPRALRAQYSKKGYNYGGLETLRFNMEKGKGMKVFNLEQQADIVADYFRIKNGYQARWGTAKIADLPIYQHYVDQLKSHFLRVFAW